MWWGRLRIAMLMVSVAGAMLAVWIWPSSGHAEGRSRLGDVLRARDGDSETDVSATVVLSLLAAAMGRGASVTRALQAVGRGVGGAVGEGLCKASTLLCRAVPWREAWLSARLAVEEGLAGSEGESAEIRLLRIAQEALRPAWERGASPVRQLRAAAEQLDVDERSRIEQEAGRLSVRLLLPTGLCFLPAFVCVGVIPAVASFLA